MRRGLSFLGCQVYLFTRLFIFCRRWDKKEGKQLFHYGGWDNRLCEAC